MRIRREEFRTDNMTFNQTYQEDLPESGILQSINLYVRSTQNASGLVDVEKWRLIDYIDKVEVIAGSEVIFSLSGKQAIAAAFYRTGIVPTYQWRNYSSVPHRQNIPILFGRGYNDFAHGLDLSRFKNVKLKVKNSATSTQFTTDIDLTIMLNYIEDASVVGGYYRQEEIEAWSPSNAGTTRYIKLPTDLPVERILLELRPGKSASDFSNYSSMSRLGNPVKLTRQDGRLTMWEGNIDYIARQIHDELGVRLRVQMENYHSAAKFFETGVGYITGLIGAPGTYGAVSAYVDTYLRDDQNDSAIQCLDRAADAPINVVAEGLSFCHVTPLFVSRDPSDADLLTFSRDGQIKLDVTIQSGTTVTVVPNCAVVTSRLVA